MTVYADPSGRGPSDHSSFYGAGIPVLFFFSGVHDVYHKPGDKGYSVDPRGTPGVLSLVEKIALWRAGDAKRLEYWNGVRDQQAPEQAAAGSDRGYAPVRLGIQPGLVEEGESGIKVEGVSAGTSAADAGIKMTHVPYRGAAPAMQDLLAGVVDLSFESSLTNTVTNHQAGRLKVLATTGSVRVPILAQVPTVAESGYPGFVAQGWFGFFGPAGLPAPVVKRLNDIATQMLRDKAVVERFEKLGIQPDPSSPEQFVRFLQEQDRIWAGIARGLNLQLD